MTRSVNDHIARLVRSPLFRALVFLLAIALLTAVGPAERSLGVNVRVVYLHGVWVWTSLVVLIAAGAVGLAAIFSQRQALHGWSNALGKTGLLFWITYLPISVWAMQTNWNGLYFSEPRWRLALIFAVSGFLLQVGLALINHPNLTSAANLAFVILLLFALASTQEVMHPRSPILQSDSRWIQIYFLSLMTTTMLVAWQIARAWAHLGHEPKVASFNSRSSTQ